MWGAAARGAWGAWGAAARGAWGAAARGAWGASARAGGRLQAREYATRKRFYRRTDILRGDGKFEIRLDQRRLKTPRGAPLLLDSEPLALAVAAEWDAQDPNIVPANMHLVDEQSSSKIIAIICRARCWHARADQLIGAQFVITTLEDSRVTSLCNTVLDNPSGLSKYDIATYLVNYLPTDTLLFQSAEEDELYKFQREKWEPVLEWFRRRFDVALESTRELETPAVSARTSAVLSRHILSYDFASANALMFGVEALKSVVLMLACAERLVTPEQAVMLSRLEEEFQVGHWGRVEWAHELSQQELQARVAAALLLVQCASRADTARAKCTAAAP